MEDLILDELTLNKISEYCQASKYSYTTWYVYTTSLKKMAKEYGKINQKVALDWMKKFKNPSKIAIINLINNYCIYNEIDFFIKRIKIRKDPRKIPEVLTFDEVKKFIDNIPEEYKLVFKCIYNIGGGLRISDAVKMRFGNINWAQWLENRDDQGIIILRKSKRNKDHVHNVPKSLMEELYKYAEENKLLDEFGIPEDILVFDFGIEKFKPSLREDDKERWVAEYIRHSADILRDNVLSKYSQKILGKKIRLHQLRHSRSSYLYNEEGKKIEEIRELRGDEDISTTMIYVQVGKKKLIEGMKDVKSV